MLRVSAFLLLLALTTTGTAAAPCGPGQEEVTALGLPRVGGLHHPTGQLAQELRSLRPGDITVVTVVLDGEGSPVAAYIRCSTVGPRIRRALLGSAFSWRYPSSTSRVRVRDVVVEIALSDG